LRPGDERAIQAANDGSAEYLEQVAVEPAQVEDEA
jgi:hypothetical protein